MYEQIVGMIIRTKATFRFFSGSLYIKADIMIGLHLIMYVADFLRMLLDIDTAISTIKNNT